MLSQICGQFATYLNQNSRSFRQQCLDATRAQITTRPLSDGDKRLLDAPRERTAITRALSVAAGRELTLELVYGREPRPEDAPKPDDFTQEVAKLFDGDIEREQ